MLIILVPSVSFAGTKVAMAEILSLKKNEKVSLEIHVPYSPDGKNPCIIRLDPIVGGQVVNFTYKTKYVLQYKSSKKKKKWITEGSYTLRSYSTKDVQWDVTDHKRGYFRVYSPTFKKYSNVEFMETCIGPVPTEPAVPISNCDVILHDYFNDKVSYYKILQLRYENYAREDLSSGDFLAADLHTVEAGIYEGKAAEAQEKADFYSCP